jgi:urease accessory protein
MLGFAANLVSASVRLGIVGQTDGQRVLAGLMPAISRAAAELVNASLDDLGACAFRSDIASLRHETQYSRLFRS